MDKAQPMKRHTVTESVKPNIRWEWSFYNGERNGKVGGGRTILPTNGRWDPLTMRSEKTKTHTQKKKEIKKDRGQVGH